MTAQLLGISSSPRLNGNSDLLLREALAAAEAAGAICEYLRLADFSIAACTECNGCYKTGRCVVQDDYQQIFEKIVKAELLIFATPVFFMNVCAQAKLLIDRCQCLWARKYILGRSPLRSTGLAGRALVIAVGGSKSRKMFDSIKLTMKYYLDAVDMCYWANLFVNKVDEAGKVRQHPAALKEARRLGRELVTTDSCPETPTDISLF